MCERERERELYIERLREIENSLYVALQILTLGPFVGREQNV